MAAQIVYAGSDHAGFHLKEHLARTLGELGCEVVDLGAADAVTSVDYPDFAEAVARKVAAGGGALGVLCCGSGIGMCIAANKVAGVRAAVVTDPYSARMARQHNDANVLCLGERVVGEGVADACVRAFLAATFEGGRHARRVDKIKALEPKGP